MEANEQQNKALKLLKEYRLVLWRKSALEVIPDANNKSLLICLERIRLTKELVESLKGNMRTGEKMFWILHTTFMTEKQPGDVEEILADIAGKFEKISRRTYFRLKKQAIKKFSEYQISVK